MSGTVEGLACWVTGLSSSARERSIAGALRGAEATWTGRRVVARLGCGQEPVSKAVGVTLWREAESGSDYDACERFCFSLLCAEGDRSGCGVLSEGPLMRMVMHWCWRRSSRASTSGLLSKSSYHAS